MYDWFSILDELKAVTILCGISILVILTIFVLQCINLAKNKKQLKFIAIVMSLLNGWFSLQNSYIRIWLYFFHYLVILLAIIIGLLEKNFSEEYSLLGFKLSDSFTLLCVGLGINVLHFILEIIEQWFPKNAAKVMDAN